MLDKRRWRWSNIVQALVNVSCLLGSRIYSGVPKQDKFGEKRDGRGATWKESGQVIKQAGLVCSHFLEANKVCMDSQSKPWTDASVCEEWRM